MGSFTREQLAEGSISATLATAMAKQRRSAQVDLQHNTIHFQRWRNPGPLDDGNFQVQKAARD